MKSVSLASPRHLAGTVKPTMLDSLARRSVLRQLEGLRYGSLNLSDGERQHRFGTAGDDLEAHIHVCDPRFYSEVAFGGSIGGGEGYMHGYWQCDDLVALGHVVCHVLHDQEIGQRGEEMQAGKLGHRPQRAAVRRKADVMRLGHGGDFLHLQQPARAPGVGLDHVHDLALDQLPHAPGVRVALAGSDRQVDRVGHARDLMFDEWPAGDRQQRFGGMVRQRTHALAASGGKQRHGFGLVRQGTVILKNGSELEKCLLFVRARKRRAHDCRDAGGSAKQDARAENRSVCWNT